MYVFIMYIMCLIIFEGKAEVHDQYPLRLNLVQKDDDPIQDYNRHIGPLSRYIFHKKEILQVQEVHQEILYSR